MSSPEPASPARSAQIALTVGPLGVVFGDIGTSPLDAFLSRNARPVKDYYKTQPMQVIEIGLSVQL